MKKLLLLFTIICLGQQVAQANVAADESILFENDNLLFQILSEEDKTCKLVDKYYHNLHEYYEYYYTGDIIVPSTAYYNNKEYTVASIGGEAFESHGLNSVTSVILPNTVKRIGSCAFYK